MFDVPTRTLTAATIKPMTSLVDIILFCDTDRVSVLLISFFSLTLVFTVTYANNQNAYGQNAASSSVVYNTIWFVALSVSQKQAQ